MSFLKDMAQALTPSFLSVGKDQVKVEDSPAEDMPSPILSPVFEDVNRPGDPGRCDPTVAPQVRENPARTVASAPAGIFADSRPVVRLVDPQPDPQQIWHSTRLPDISDMDRSRTLTDDRTRSVRGSGDKKMTPHPFEGKEDLRDYLEQFQAIAEWNGWSYEQKGCMLQCSLLGEAEQVLRDSLRKDYDAIVVMLNHRFN